MTAPKSELEKLHAALAKKLAEKIADGSATAADMAVARQFLKDNGIDAIPRAGSPLATLRDQLPFPSPDAIAADNEQVH